MCEDFPCCGHESGCCPDFKDGKQLNMRCTCGAVLPLNNRVSICNGCLAAARREDGEDGPEYPEDTYDEDFDDDDAEGRLQDEDFFEREYSPDDDFERDEPDFGGE